MSTAVGVGLLVLGVLLTVVCVLLVGFGDGPTRLLGGMVLLAVAPMTYLLARELWDDFRPI